MIKTQWEIMKESACHYIYINYNEVVYGSHYGSGHSDNATTFSYESVLKGEHDVSIKNDFSEEILNELKENLKKAEFYEPFIVQRESDKKKNDFLGSIKVDNSIEAILKDKDTENGFKAYGTHGMYGTKLETDKYTLVIDAEDFYNIKSTITHKSNGKKYKFSLKLQSVSTIYHDDHFFLIVNDQFVVVNAKGKIVYDTNSLVDSRGEKIFGTNLRATRTLKKDGRIIVTCMWMGSKFKDPSLEYSIKEKNFIGKYEI